MSKTIALSLLMLTVATINQAQAEILDLNCELSDATGNNRIQIEKMVTGGYFISTPLGRQANFEINCDTSFRDTRVIRCYIPRHGQGEQLVTPSYPVLSTSIISSASETKTHPHEELTVTLNQTFFLTGTAKGSYSFKKFTAIPERCQFNP